MRHALVALFLLSPAVLGIQYYVQDQTTCGCDLATFRLIAENLADEKVYEVLEIDSPIAYPKTLDVQVLPGEKKEFTFYAQSCEVRPHPIYVRATKASLEPTLFVKPCQGISLRVTAEQSVCQNQQATFVVNLENVGRNEETVLLSTDLNPKAYTMPNQVVLQPREQKNVFLIVNSLASPQRLPFKVKAFSESGEKEQTAIIEVNACEGLVWKGPTQIEAAVNQTQTIALSLRNLGKTGYSILLHAACPSWVNFKNQTIALNSSATQTVSFDLRAPTAGEYPCTFFAKPEGEARSYSHNMVFNIQRTQARIEVSPRAFEIEQGIETPLTFTLKNQGGYAEVHLDLRTVNAYVVSLPKTLFLGKNEEKNITVTVKGNKTSVSEGVLFLNKTTESFRLSVIKPTLEIQATVYQIAQGRRVDYVFTNLGASTRIELVTSPPAEGPSSIELKTNSQGFASFTTNTTEQALTLVAKTNRGAYTHHQSLSEPRPLPLTGLVTYATPVLAFALAILLALVILYTMYRRSQASSHSFSTRGAK